jgi:hypothetical protein
MPLLDSGPCQNWPYICDDFPEAFTPEQQDLIDQAVQAATEVLWERTQRRYGECTVTLRPCGEECGRGVAAWGAPAGWTWPFPVLDRGRWINLACRGCGGTCHCGRLEQVRLPSPVAEILEVKVDGVALDPSAYRVDDWRWLVRLDGGTWPPCNDLELDDDQPGTWSVTATYGEQVPTIGSYAVGELASAIYKACTGASDCPIPRTTVRQVSRQGVTKVYFDAATAFRGGQVGLYFADLFIATENPGGRRAAKLYDIDRPRARNAGSVPGPIPAGS